MPSAPPGAPNLQAASAIGKRPRTSNARPELRTSARGYDANQNLTFDGTRTFVYDGDNRLVSESASGTSTSLAYDPTGRLQTQATTAGGTTTTTYLYDGDALVAEYNAGTVLRRYAHGPGEDDPLVWYEGSTLTSAGANYLIADRQGSIVGYSNAGAIAASYAYDPYGDPAAWGGSRFRYTGQIEIPEVQLYDYKARFYDPGFGHFLQTDPVGYKDNLNLYGYVNDDPTDLTDPTGLTCEALMTQMSAYCQRSYEYAQFDRALGGQTRFFGAASMTTAMLADLSMYPVNLFVVSQATRSFMDGLSRDLQSMNEREALAIEHGSLGGANLDARMVHAEQTAVQGHLDAFAARDPSGYKSMIGEVNGLLNPKGAQAAAANVYGDDRHYQGVLNGVMASLGHDINFGNQSDREAVGNALVRDLRNSGACTQTGSRIPTC